MLGIAHFSLVVSDIEHSADYYTRWLGFKRGERSENQRLKMCSLHRDSLTLELLEYKQAEGAPPPGNFNHLAFFCGDLDSFASRAAQDGILPAPPDYRQSPDGRRLFFLEGPDRERLEFLDRYPATLHPLEKSLAVAVEEFSQTWRRLAEKSSPGRVHDLRVASRRLNVIMSYCSNICPPAGLKTARKHLQTLFDLLGRLRDCQVELDFLHHSDDSILDSHPLVNLLESEEKGLLRKLQRKIEAFDLDSFENQMRKYQRKLHMSIYKQKREEVCALMSSRLFAEYRHDLVTARNRISSEHPGSIHRFRIAVKKVRYSLETLHEYLGLDPAEIDLLRELQDSAGQIHDLSALAAKVENADSIKAGNRQIMLNLLQTRRDELSARFIENLGCQELEGLWV